MLKNYLLTGWRSLVKNKLFSIINVFGLALSMSVGIIQLISISDALDYDTFHPKSEDVYRIISNITGDQGNNWTLASTPLPLSVALNERLSGSVAATRIYPAVQSVMKDQSREFNFSGVFIEPAFFEVFGFQSQPDHPSALAQPNVIMLSERFSNKFFGDADPSGRLVTLQNFGEFQIAGIIKTPPSKSHIDYDVYISMSTVPLLERSGKLQAKIETWDSFEQGYTYVRLTERKNENLLSNTLEQLSKDITKDSREHGTATTKANFELELQPLNKINPSPSDLFNEIGKGPTRGGLLAGVLIVLVVLIAACFNYTNLSIARSLTRNKEIGIRKLSGATRSQVVIQYIIEAVLVSLFALIVANFIVAPILEYKPFNDGYEMIPELRFSWRFVGFIFGFTVFSGLMAGALPALLLSSLKPIIILRGISNQKLLGRMSLRRALLVFQFSLSLIVLVFLSTFYLQFEFLATADLGFARENIVLVPQGVHPQVTATMFDDLNGVTKVGFTSARFGQGPDVNLSQQTSGEGPVNAEYYACNRAWLEIMDLDVVAGEENLKDLTQVMINEKAATALGFTSADAAVGSSIFIRDSLKVSIVGVVRDFYSHGYGNAIHPVVFQNSEHDFKTIAVETVPGVDITDELGTIWKKQNPSSSFDYVALGEEKEQSRQLATVSLLGFLGFITLTIASLGLLGLVVYTVEVKRKEISIRKIVGASVHQLIALLSKNFIALLLIAGVIALPIGYALSELFLMNFVNRISPGLVQLSLCVGLLLSIGLITILSQTWTAANENPARNLRSE